MCTLNDTNQSVKEASDSRDDLSGISNDATMTGSVFQSLSLESSESPTRSNLGSTDLKAIPEEGLQYVTGFVCYRFRDKYPHLGKKTIEEDECNDWIGILSRGNLIRPSDEFLNVAYKLENIFQTYHGQYFKKKTNILKDVYELLRSQFTVDEEKFPKVVLMCWIRTRTYIRIREINKQVIADDQKRAFLKKMKKILN